jgi:hypothetical protein
MYSQQIQQTWRRSLVSKLKDCYGLAEDEARAKVDVWLHWITQDAESTTSPEVSTAEEIRSRRRPLRPPGLRVSRQQMTTKPRSRS